ncbi:MAG: UbiD family decarboxylase [Comamonadaceae bacterium]|nr:UbiD family decarboxylase [Comamonadaceae bacterium]
MGDGRRRDSGGGACARSGELLAFLKEPEPPKGLTDAWENTRRCSSRCSTWRRRSARPRRARRSCGRAPTSTSRACRCRPAGRATSAPLITWGLTVTRGPHKKRQNLGIYRQQVIAPQQGDHALAGASRRRARLPRPRSARIPATPFPVAVALGADPATILGAVTPVPDSLSEYQFAGLLRGAQDRDRRSASAHDLQVPASAEIVLEGVIHPGRRSRRRRRPVRRPHRLLQRGRAASRCSPSSASRMRRDPIYHCDLHRQAAGRAGDARRGAERGLRAAAAEAVPGDRRLLPAARGLLATASRWCRMKKQYPGHAKRVMFGVWSFLRQFMYTKFIIVTDDDVNVRDWKEVIWALTTRVDPARDTLIVENTPIDYLDFASPVSGLGSKLGIDATNKWPGETAREWGRPIAMDADVKARVDALARDIGV